MLNSSKGLDVKVYNASMLKYRELLFFAGHRNGTTGLAAPHTADIARFYAAWRWIKAHLEAEPEHQTNDTRFWVEVPPI